VIARWGGRRLFLAALLVTAGLLAGVLTGIQIRAAQAQEQRAAAAAAEALRAAAAEARLAAHLEAVAELWALGVADAESGIAHAEAVLTASEGMVDDDAVRVALAQSVADLRAKLDHSEPSPDELFTLRSALRGLASAIVAVEQAQVAWQSAQESAQESAPPPAPAPARSSWPDAGAGPDCGGPESYEPPSGSGPVFYTSTPTDAGDGSNGHIPSSQMTPLGWCVDSQGNSQWLRTDAAQALISMNEAFRARFGENIAIDLSYRSYDDQVAMREAYGSVAARPGTSNHGWGTAFDTWEWQAYSFGSARYEWLVANGPAHGWVAPAWARAGGSNPEYWHFEYTG
jgi:LAS superfamily LD-carboxypeptidase LdcB